MTPARAVVHRGPANFECFGDIRWAHALRLQFTHPDRYTLVVSARADRAHARPWGWEIYRNGEPLPARLRADGFKSEYPATLAGRAALRDSWRV
jgi:hypothetical protein